MKRLPCFDSLPALQDPEGNFLPETDPRYAEAVSEFLAEGKGLIRVHKCFSTYTEESVQEGDFEESGSRGYEFLTFRELCSAMRGYSETSSCPIDPDRAQHVWIRHLDDEIYSGDIISEETSLHFADRGRKAKYWLKALRMAFPRRFSASR